MHKTHPYFWCSILGQKGASNTRMDTVRVLSLDQMFFNSTIAKSFSKLVISFDIRLASLEQHIFFQFCFFNHTCPLNHCCGRRELPGLHSFRKLHLFWSCPSERTSSKCWPSRILPVSHFCFCLCKSVGPHHDKTYPGIKTFIPEPFAQGRVNWTLFLLSSWTLQLLTVTSWDLDTPWGREQERLGSTEFFDNRTEARYPQYQYRQKTNVVLSVCLCHKHTHTHTHTHTHKHVWSDKNHETDLQWRNVSACPASLVISRFSDWLGKAAKVIDYQANHSRIMHQTMELISLNYQMSCDTLPQSRKGFNHLSIHVLKEREIPVKWLTSGPPQGEGEQLEPAKTVLLIGICYIWLFSCLWIIIVKLCTYVDNSYWG